MVFRRPAAEPFPGLIFMRKAILLVLLAGCGNTPVLPTLTPYKIDIQQGNYVTQEMVSKLRPGMTRAQVRFILGTPLVVDPFRDDRWDYVYLYRKRGELVEHRRFAVIFKDDKLVRIEGDVVPATVDSAPGARPATTQSEPGSADTPRSEQGKSSSARGAEPSPAATQNPGTAGEPSGSPPSAERGFFGRMLDKLGF